ncbi:hypothetical protein TNCV_1636931 [Trichonephila clavipes]|nr:hypothetical protein TNCV_1636931 [Trichonephila clavipes]
MGVGTPARAQTINNDLMVTCTGYLTAREAITFNENRWVRVHNNRRHTCHLTAGEAIKLIVNRKDGDSQQSTTSQYIRPGHLMYRLNQNTAVACDVIKSDRRLRILAVSELVNLDKEVVRRILTDELRMRKIYTKVVPKVMSDDQTQ